MMLPHGRHKEESDDDSDRSSEQSLQEDLPSHACSYCAIRNKSCVVKCSNKTCGKWFCNEKGQNGFASHIVFHLVKSKHNQIATHPEGDFGDLAIECFVCGNTNVFVLGFVQVKEGNQSSAIFICRAPCVNDKKATEFEWNPQKWEPLIQQKQIVNWVAKKATKEEPRNEYSVQQMIRLEEAWKMNPRLKSTDVLKKKPTRRLRSVYLKYKSGKQYKSIFESLLSEESKTDRKIKESQTQNNMKITFSHNNGKRYAYFMFGSREDYDASLLPGNELKISYKNEWSSKGVVVKITGSNIYSMKIKKFACSFFHTSLLQKRNTLIRQSLYGNQLRIIA